MCCKCDVTKIKTDQNRIFERNFFMFRMIGKVCFVALFLTMASFFAGCGNDSVLEETAVEVVNDILEANVDDPAKCIAVKITEKITDNHYKAIATLDNGNDISVLIEERGDMVYVTIPEEYFED